MAQEQPGDWARYWRSPDGQVEAMHARFCGHVYHRHSHDTYSLGVTESGAQAFTCRGAGHVSTAGLVMAFNPDDPARRARRHRERLHLPDDPSGSGPADRPAHRPHRDRAAGMPLFAEPVLTDPALATALRRLHRSLTGPASPLEQSERLAAVAALAARQRAARARTCPGRARPPG